MANQRVFVARSTRVECAEYVQGNYYMVEESLADRWLDSGVAFANEAAAEAAAEADRAALAAQDVAGAVDTVTVPDAQPNQDAPAEPVLTVDTPAAEPVEE